jgi:hypothetical protein
MTRDHFLHILCYLHFTDNDNEIDKNNKNYDRLWKIRQVFDMLNVAYSKVTTCYGGDSHLKRTSSENVIIFVANNFPLATHVLSSSVVLRFILA